MRVVQVLAIVAGALLLTGAARAPTVDYSLSPVFEGETLTALAVEVRFTGEADGETRLELPRNWGGEKDMWRRLADVTVEGGELVAGTGPERVVRHRPGARLVLRYRIAGTLDRDPPIEDSYRPVVAPNGFHVLGNKIFAKPDGRTQSRATFTWKGWPRDWTLVSDLDHGRMGRPMHVGDVVESVSVGGTDLRVETRQIAGGVVRVAVRGDWPFAPEAFADQIAAILSAQRGFWRDLREPFFVSLIPVASEGPGATSIGGTGRGDAFAMFATRNADIATLRYVIGHEHIHTWIPRRLGRMPEGEEASDYWFSEGLTDFYTYRTLLRAGVWRLEDFAEYANESIAAYDQSSVRTEPNARITKDFWNDPEVEKLPYQRGMMLAFWWDARVRAATGDAKDLDDVLFLMRGRMAAAGSREQADLVRPGFVRAMKDVAGLDVAPDIARYIDAGEPLTLPADLFGRCTTVVSERRPVFERGWDAERTRQNGDVITGLKPDSQAYAAGLRDGMKIIGRDSGRAGNTRIEYVLRVLDGGAERVIRFFPVGKATYAAREIVLTQGLDEAARKACAARISGA